MDLLGIQNLLPKAAFIGTLSFLIGRFIFSVWSDKYWGIDNRLAWCDVPYSRILETKTSQATIIGEQAESPSYKDDIYLLLCIFTEHTLYITGPSPTNSLFILIDEEKNRDSSKL
jgi:hypothetical protein